MNKLLVALFAGAFSFALPAFADDSDIKPLSKMQTEEAKAARAAAQAKWNAMSPQEQAAAKKAARTKKLMDATAIDTIASENMNYIPPSKAEQAESKAVPKPTKEQRKEDVSKSTKPTTGQ